MTRSMVFLILTGLSSAGCGGGGSGSEAEVADEVVSVVSDIDAMKEATTAANRIIRNAADCTFVQENIKDVNQSLDEIGTKVQTGAGRTSLQSLQKQVKTIAEACGAF